MESDFGKINFGKAAAENERGMRYSYLLNDGFLDAYGYINKILDDSHFLILGSKGSGKSAIGTKLQLMSENPENKLFTKLYSLNDFSYSEFDKLYASDEPSEIRYSNYWQFLLLLLTFNSIIQDKTVSTTLEGVDLEKVEEVYRKHGLLPDSSVNNIMDVTPVQKILHSLYDFCLKIKTPVISGSISGKRVLGDKTLSREQLFSALSDVCFSLTMSNQHIIVIDDLDYILFQEVSHKEIQFSSLLALIMSANTLNSKFEAAGINIKIVILCRTDIFNSLSGPNIGKIADDKTIKLNWYQTASNVYTTNIVKLINLRAKISLKQENDINIFEQYFPESYSGASTRYDSLKHLLNWTRHTPRDIIQLMNHIQDTVLDGSELTSDKINDGIRNYAVNSFINEIRDGMAGFLERKNISLALELITSMRMKNFLYSDLLDKINSDVKYQCFTPDDLLYICNLLYDLGAIGHYEESDSRKHHYSFKFRNQTSSFNPDMNITLHFATARAYNIDTRFNSVARIGNKY